MTYPVTIDGKDYDAELSYTCETSDRIIEFWMDWATDETGARVDDNLLIERIKSVLNEEHNKVCAACAQDWIDMSHAPRSEHGLG